MARAGLPPSSTQSASPAAAASTGTSASTGPVPMLFQYPFTIQQAPRKITKTPAPMTLPSQEPAPALPEPSSFGAAIIQGAAAVAVATSAQRSNKQYLYSQDSQGKLILYFLLNCSLQVVKIAE